MHISPSAQRLLSLVFAASSAALTRPRLERQAGFSRSELNRALAELAQLGLLDARRLRLTMSGLALAVAFGAQSKAMPSASRRPSAAVSALSAPIALFSRREPPRAVA